MSKNLRLSPNQADALHAIVTGQLGGRAYTAVQSLIKRGLVVESVRSVFEPCPVAPGVRWGGQGRTVKRTEYLLTPEGLEAYTKMRTTWYESKIRTLEKEFKTDMAKAERKVKS